MIVTNIGHVFVTIVGLVPIFLLVHHLALVTFLTGVKSRRRVNKKFTVPIGWQLEGIKSSKQNNQLKQTLAARTSII